ncbi:MAG: MarR family winged helix-turn-helix transcriptional regulator [Phycisphaerales bacterium JB038]
MTTGHEQLIEQVQRIGSAFDALRKGSLFAHQGVQLYASELHMMRTVAAHPDANASEIAALLGVTKGAVSQTLSKLEAKGICDKESDPEHKNELRIWLTPRGSRALAAFQKQITKQWSALSAIIDDLPARDRRVIGHFLAGLEDFLVSLR